MAPWLSALATSAICAIVALGCEQRRESTLQTYRENTVQFDNPTESQIPDLTNCFRSGDKDVRKEAALAIATIGSAKCKALVIEALADDDDYVRSYAMMGIGRGIEAKCATNEFLESVVPGLVKLLNRDDSSVSGEAPELLLLIDEKKAVPILFAREVFTIQNSQLQYVLRALNRKQVEVPHDKLLPLLNELKSIADKYPHSYEYAEALVAYGQNPDDLAEMHLRSELRSPNDEVRAGAGRGLMIYHKVENPYRHACGIMEAKGMEALTDPQRHYIAVSVYRWEVENGGHSQYFFNSSGDAWKSALAGLLAIGAKERVKILEEASSKFGLNGPSEDRAARNKQLQRLPGRQQNTFAALDDRFYAAREDIDVLLPLYAIDNKSHFTQKVMR